MDSVVGEIDIFTSATGNFDIITLAHMKKMKNNAIVGNIGHFDNEIDMNGLENMKGIKVENIIFFTPSPRLADLLEIKMKNHNLTKGHYSAVHLRAMYGRRDHRDSQELVVLSSH